MLILLPVSVFSQNYVRGTISDKSTGEKLAFVNIAVVGSGVGTMTDTDGSFSLDIPDKYSDASLSVSSVGYSSYSLSIADNLNKVCSIALEPIDYKIDEIVVVDKSAAGKKTIRNVVDAFSNNCLISAYSCKGIFTQTFNSRKSVFNFSLYDNDGIVFENVADVYKNKNFKFEKVSHVGFKVDDFQSGRVFMDLFFEFDPLENNNLVLNPDNFNLFDYTVLSDTVIDNLSAQIISFKNIKNPDYHGLLYVDKNSSSLLKAVYSLKTDKFSFLGSSIDCQNENSPVTISFVSRYARTIMNKYAPVESQLIISSKQNTLSQNITFTDYYISDKISAQGKIFYCR